MDFLTTSSTVFNALRWVISSVSVIYMVYQVVLALFAFVPMKKKKKLFDKQHKISAVISARNEEVVIGSLIRSLFSQNYPQELMNVIVIADNCTDNTAAVAEQAGARVFVRNEPDKATKGFALNWLFKRLLADDTFDSDAICVFDADNLVDKNFFSAMNDQLCAGVKIAQGYRESKNPSDTWISGDHSMYFWNIMRFCQVPRYNLGMSCILGGTGFLVSMDILREDGGWNTSEMCEDIEYSMYQIAKGYKISFAFDAIFYDEQPTSFKQSWRQRMRWTTGNWNCLRACVPKLVRSTKQSPWILFDGIMFLMSVPCVFAGTFAILFDVVARSLGIASLASSLMLIPFSLIGSLLLVYFEGILLLLVERKSFKRVWKGFIMYPVFWVSYTLVNIWGVIHPVKQWAPIIHKKSVDEVV